jgi:predicted DNA-binding transcriptional regulator YafY
LLQSGGVRTVAELAGRLGVDERTVRRYADHLIDLDVPVESVRGRYGGYRLGPGYRLPPLMLTDDEALAVLIGLPAGAAAADSAVVLSIADAVRHHRPVSIRYTAGDGRRSERILHPYGLVVHSGRWYATGADPGTGEDRTFRLDRIAGARTLPGSFEPPVGADPVQRLLSGLANAPYRHLVSLRIQGTAEQIRARLPASVATLEEIRGLQAVR